MLFAAVTVGVITVLTALFLVKRSPAEYGTEPYRTGNKTDQKDSRQEKAPSGSAYLKKLPQNPAHGTASLAL